MQNLINLSTLAFMAFVMLDTHNLRKRLTNLENKDN